jgi:WD40 repeat protein
MGRELLRFLNGLAIPRAPSPGGPVLAAGRTGRTIDGDDGHGPIGVTGMEELGRTGRADWGMAFAWRRWQLGLVGLGIILGIVVAGGDLKTKAGREKRPAARTGQEDHETPIWALAFGGSTRLVSSTTAGEVRVTDLVTGEVRRLEDPGSYARSVAFSPGGRILALGWNGPGVQLWDVEAGIELEPLKAGMGAVRSATFSPDGTKLAMGTWKSERQRGIVTLWEWPSRRRLAELGPFEGGINALAFSPDGGRLVIADSSGRTLLWDVGSGKELAHRRAHDAGIMGLAFSPDGRLFATAAYADGVVRLWDAIGGGPRGSRQVSTAVAALAFSPDGTTLAMARGDGIASLSDVATGREIRKIRVSTGALQAIAFSEDGRVLATGGIDGSVRLWDVKTEVSEDLRGASLLRSDRGATGLAGKDLTPGKAVEELERQPTE